MDWTRRRLAKLGTIQQFLIHAYLSSRVYSLLRFVSLLISVPKPRISLVLGTASCLLVNEGNLLENSSCPETLPCMSLQHQRTSKLPGPTRALQVVSKEQGINCLPYYIPIFLDDEVLLHIQHMVYLSSTFTKSIHYLEVETFIVEDFIILMLPLKQYTGTQPH